MTIWLTADTHFHHKNIIKYCKRPFDSVEEMNERLIDNWNVCVGSDDFVYHLGDFGFGKARELGDIRIRLNGSIVLILGNHDLHVSAGKWLDEVGMSAVLTCSSLDDLWLCHYPRGDEYPLKGGDRLKRPLNDELWALTGHVHDKWRIKDKCLNVGVDVQGFKPISLAEAKKQIKDFHDHNPN